MVLTRKIALALLSLAALALSACGGGGGGAPLTISAINLNPSAPSAGSVVSLSVATTGGNGTAATKSWTVSAGTLQLTPPDFSLLLRETARGKGASASSLSTTSTTVYWITPASASSATISVTIDTASKNRTVNLGASPVTLSVTDAAGGKKLCTVQANDVTDLYQAAFRINFTSAWHPETVTRGDFLGSNSETLFIGLTNQSGFVPVALTRKGNVAGVDGSGTLATVLFAPGSGTSALRGGSASDLPFDIGLVILRNSKDQAIAVE
jgi:hypothetical protein